MKLKKMAPRLGLLLLTPPMMTDKLVDRPVGHTPEHVSKALLAVETLRLAVKLLVPLVWFANVD